MYKLILVDDEEEVRRGIIEKIEWRKYGFEIAGEAENGIEALEMAQRLKADLVITDIKMPFMDGLALAEALSRRLPTVRIIVLTGFDEFEYAQRAVKLDVVEYVLKPVSSAELIGILQRVKDKLDNEIAHKKDIETLKEHYKKSMPLLREKFLNQVIKYRLSRKEIRDKAPAYGLDLNGMGFMVAVFNGDYFDQDTLNRIAGENIKRSLDLSISEGRELVNIALMHICEEIVNKYDAGVVFQSPDHNVIIFDFKKNNEQESIKEALSILEEICQSTEKYFNILITFGVGKYCSDTQDIPYCYDGAATALDYRIILPHNHIILIEDIEPKCTKGIIFDEMKERSLISTLRVGTSGEIRGTIEDLFRNFTDCKASFKDYQIYLLEILATVLRAAMDMGVDMEGIFDKYCDLFVDIYKFKSLEELKEWLYGICMEIKNSASIERQDACRQIIKRALEFVEKSYDDSELTIDKMCSFLHISPAYFSAIFKRETRTTFVNYLTHVRMEAAKELLRTSDVKTFEIAKRVGYSEPNYFSYCFKKNFNISPSEYRKGYSQSGGWRIEKNG